MRKEAMYMEGCKGKCQNPYNEIIQYLAITINYSSISL